MRKIKPYTLPQHPLLVVITGLSGAGKDSVVKEMQQRGCPFHFIITVADRPPRAGELHGRDYIFVTPDEFKAMNARGEFLENAVVYEQNKGIPRASVQAAVDSGKDAVVRVDVQGALTVKRLIPAAVTVFLTVESEEELAYRLHSRRSESAEQRQKRIATAREELTCIPKFDYVVVNRRDALEAAVDDVVAIMRAEHCRSELREIVL
ncbi:MAG TPA: guanylate kinase [Anaerolineae bacterium]|nr:guanylate kinase [Anaerolineae bacterium]